VVSPWDTTGIRVWYPCDNPAVRARILLSTTLTLLALAPAGRAQTPARLAVLSSNAIVVMPAGVGTHAQDDAGAAALMRFLTGPGAASALQAAGMTPAR
jgi:hypothetical protein